jgi:hypothetical protein
MEGLQVASAAISLTKVLLQLSKDIATFLERANRADSNELELHKKVSYLHGRTELFARRIKAREEFIEKNWWQIPQQEKDDLHTLREHIEETSGTLRKFRKGVAALNEGAAPEWDWLRRLLLQKRIDRSESRFSRYEKALDGMLLLQKDYLMHGME